MDVSRLVLPGTVQLKQVLEAMNFNRSGSVLVVDEGNVLLGVVSDGDVRRAILRGSILQTPVSRIFNRNSKFLLEEHAHPKQIADFFAEHHDIVLLPILRPDRSLVSVCRRTQDSFEQFNVCVD